MLVIQIECYKIDHALRLVLLFSDFPALWF